MFFTFQVVLSHTPYRELAKDLGDKPVVISGRGASEVAKAYGFMKAVTTSQLSARYPTAVPFCHDPGMGLSTTHFRLCVYVPIYYYPTYDYIQ